MTYSFANYLRQNKEARELFAELLGNAEEHLSYLRDTLDELDRDTVVTEVDGVAVAARSPDTEANETFDYSVDDYLDEVISAARSMDELFNNGLKKEIAGEIAVLERTSHTDPDAIKAAMTRRVELEKVLAALQVPQRVRFERTRRAAEAAVDTASNEWSGKGNKDRAERVLRRGKKALAAKR